MRPEEATISSLRGYVEPSEESIRNILANLARFTLAHPKKILLLTAFPCLCLCALVPGIPMDLSFAAVLPKEQPLVARFSDMNEKLAFGSQVVYLLEGAEPALDEAAEAMVELEARTDVQRVLLPPDPQWLEAQAPWLVGPDLFDEWLEAATKPLGKERMKSLSERLVSLRGEYESQLQEIEGTRVVMLVLAEDPIFQRMGESSFMEVDRAATELVAPFGVSASASGLAAISSQDQQRTFRRITMLSPLSLLFVLAILRKVEPRLLYLALVALPMLIAMPATWGLAGRLTGQITMLESMFGIMLFGLGVDFALHLISRQREELAAGASFEEALVRTMSGTGLGVMAGAFTTIGSFCIISFAPDPGAFHLGLSGAIGLFICLALMLTMLPALWVLLYRRSKPAPLPDLEFPFVLRSAQWSVEHVKPVLALSLAVVVLSLAGGHRFKLETDLSKVFNRNVPAVQVGDRIQKTYSMNYSPWVAEVQSVEELARIHKGMEALPIVSRVDSLSRFVSGEASDRWVRLKAALPMLHRMKISYATVPPFIPAEQRERLNSMLRGIAMLEEAAESGPPAVGDMPGWLREPLIGPTGQYLLFVYTEEASMDAPVLREQRLALEAVHPGISGMGMAIEGVIADERPWLWKIFLGILCFVAALLAIDTRSLKWMCLTLLPVVFGTSATFGIFCWTGISMSVMTAMSVPLIIGLGVDDGIHVVHRLREEGGRTAAEAAAAVGRPIVLTTLTTSASFCTLLLSDHAGLESMALVLLIGLPLCLLASITLLPAAAVAMGLASREIGR
jgi:uncharacterized protein